MNGWTCSFDMDVAVKYGVEEAILIWFFQSWIRHNKAEGRHYHDGRTWTYNSTKGLLEEFPCWTKATIRRVIDSLVRQGVIMLGNFNQIAYDRTSWYAFTDEQVLLNLHVLKSANGSAEISKSKCRNQQMEVLKSANGSAEISTPIPDITTDTLQGDVQMGTPADAGKANLDPAMEAFKERCLQLTGTPYVISKADAVQLAKLRKAWRIGTRDTPPGWDDSITNYFGSPLAKYSMADLVCRYSVFKNSKLDAYNKPTNHAGSRRKSQNDEVIDQIKQEIADRHAKEAKGFVS